MLVTIPEFFLAFVISDINGKQPSPDDYENLRVATQQHLLERLAIAYTNISGVDLEFGTCDYGVNKPEPKFQVFVEAEASITFSGSPPTPQDVLESLLGTFDRDFLLRVVRPLDNASSPFASSVEVQARRLKRPTIGGGVKAPAFYAAFVCSKNPTENPSTQEEDRLLELTKNEAVRQLKKQYEDDFGELSIKIVKMEINEQAGKPEPQFNLYIEFEASATFVQNTPTPFELFQALSKVTNSEYFQGIIQIGGVFGTLTSMVCRLCIFTEVPEDEEEEGEGEGDEETRVVMVHLEFFVALVVRALTGMPNDGEMEKFEDCIVKVFSLVLKRAFRGRFIRMEITDRDPGFEKGLPVPRFNMLHQYNATLHFLEPAPSEVRVLSTIVQGNVGALFEAIKRIDSDIWKNTGEVTMGRAVEKPLTDAAFGGKLELEVEEKKVEPLVEEPAPAPAPEPLPPAPAMKTMPPKVAVVEKKPPSPPKKKVTPPKKVKLVVPLPPPKPTGPEFVSIKSFDVFTAYQLRNKEMEPLETEPLERDYKALLDATAAFYTDELKKEYGPKKFQGIEVSIRDVPEWGAGKPDNWYNVYIEWDMEAKFLVEEGEEAPSRHELTAFVVTAGCTKYLRSYVRELKDTPFALATAVFTKQYAVDMD